MRVSVDADLAILHAGTFRLDSHVPPKVAMRILRETFLYDNDKALIATSLPGAACSAVLAMGWPSEGVVGFHKISVGSRVHVDADSGEVQITSGKNPLKVVMSTFLRTRESKTDEDGYLAALNKAGLGKADVSKILKAGMKSARSVIGPFETLVSKINYDLSIRVGAPFQSTIERRLMFRTFVPGWTGSFRLGLPVITLPML